MMKYYDLDKDKKFDKETLALVLYEIAIALDYVETFSYPAFGKMFDRLDAAKSQKVIQPAHKPLRDAFIRAYFWLPEIAGQLRINPTDANARNQICGLIARIRSALDS